MEIFILDTNFFFNMEIKSGFGENSKEVIGNFTKIAEDLKKVKKAAFFMPPRILDEFFTFVDQSEDHVKNFMNVITIKSPHTAEITFPSSVFYQLVEEIRDRSYKGLRIAEELVDAAGQKMAGKADLSKMEYQKTIGDIVTKLRERYRQATRFQFLDSVADLDLIVLARELDGSVVTSDEGVLLWGRTFGIKELPAWQLQSRLLSLLQDQA